MFEYNQPMHAFDLDKLEGNITIRAAKENEEITTLDGDVRPDAGLSVFEILVEGRRRGGLARIVRYGRNSIFGCCFVRRAHADLLAARSHAR